MGWLSRVVATPPRGAQVVAVGKGPPCAWHHISIARFPYRVNTHALVILRDPDLNCTLYFVFLSSAHTRTTRRYKVQRGSANYLTPTAHRANNQKKTVQCKLQVQTRRPTIFNSNRCPSHFNDARGASQPAPVRVPHWGRLSLGSEDDENHPAAACVRSNS